MKTAWTLAAKDLRILTRDKASLFWVLLFPLLFALFFGAIFSGMGNAAGALPVAVVDQARTPGSRKMVERLVSSEALEVREMPLAKARSAVRRGKLVAWIRFPPGFGREESFFAEMGGGPGIELGMDPSRRAEKGYLQGILMEAWFEGLREKFQDPKSLRKTLKKEIRRVRGEPGLPALQKGILLAFLGSLDTFLKDFDPKAYRRGGLKGPELHVVQAARRGKRPRSSFEITFPASILWGILGCAATFALSIVRERRRGTMLRLQAAPIGVLEILAGKGLACFLASFCVALGLLFFARAALDVRWGNPALLLAGTTATAFCFSGLMMLLSNLGKNENAVAGASWAVLLVMAMTGGGMVPLVAMPSWMRALGNLSPVKWGILSLEGAIWRGFSWSEAAFPLFLLAGLGGLFFLAGTYLLSRSGD